MILSGRQQNLCIHYLEIGLRISATFRDSIKLCARSIAMNPVENALKFPVFKIKLQLSSVYVNSNISLMFRVFIYLILLGFWHYYLPQGMRKKLKHPYILLIS